MTQSPWQTHDSRTVYENAWIRVREDQVTTPDGRPGVYGVVEVRHPAVFVVAMTEADEVVLVELHRYTLDHVSLEVPAGGTDGEHALLAAQRELLEETGLVADDWRHLASTYALKGVCEAPQEVFLARGLRPAPGERRSEEGIAAVRSLPWADVLELLCTGGIRDTETAAALMFAALALGRVS